MAEKSPRILNREKIEGGGGVPVSTELVVQPNERASSATLKAIHAVADGLTRCALDVSGPEWDGSQFLKITNVRGVLSEVTIRDNGSVEWEYLISHDSETDAAHFTDVVRGVLGEDVAHDRSLLPARPRSMSLKGMVGWACGQRGLSASVEVVYIDPAFFEVWSEVEVTNPAQPERGRVRVSDEPALRWQCHIADPAGSVSGVSLTDITETIAAALTGWAGDRR
jgi:hypothetical protein